MKLLNIDYTDNRFFHFSIFFSFIRIFSPRFECLIKKLIKERYIYKISCLKYIVKNLFTISEYSFYEFHN